MYTYKEFEILKMLIDNKHANIVNYIYDNIYFKLFKDKSEIEHIVNNLKNNKYIVNNKTSSKALEEMESRKVDNAIILAAGGAAKNSKSIYSLPKGLFIKNGDTLIERQIKQLKEAGIDDITIVLGYRQELFFFLKNKYNVKLASTPAIEKGNVLSLSSVKDKLKRTYICSSDNYFTHNPFSSYEYDSFHSAVFKEECKNEIQIQTNRFGRITNMFTGKGPGRCFYGHAFIDEKLSCLINEYMDKELDIFRVDTLFWEELIMRHSEDIDWWIRLYSTNFIFEFDNIIDTQSVETLFMNDVSKKIENRITSVLNCQRNEINNIKILDKGMTNIIISFEIKNQKYLFRYPGESSWDLTSKKREVLAQNIATQIGLDKSCIYIDESGCKISYFRENLEDLSKRWFTDSALVCKCAKLMKKLHESSKLVDRSLMEFDSIAEGDRLMKLASKRKGDLKYTFGELRSKAIEIKELYQKDCWNEVLCHHDWKYDNILSNNENFDIIDWEYCSFDDPGTDLLRLLMGRDFESEIFDEILCAYFEHKPTKEKKMHIIASFVPMSYYWLSWLMYQESLGNDGFYWTLLYYNTAEKALNYTLEYYRTKYCL